MTQDDNNTGTPLNTSEVSAEWMQLSRAGELQTLGKRVLGIHTVEDEHLLGLAMIIVAALQEQKSTSQNSDASGVAFSKAARSRRLS